jgi:hypothetical protein
LQPSPSATGIFIAQRPDKTAEQSAEKKPAAPRSARPRPQGPRVDPDLDDEVPWLG